jgi:hypothetical protein
MVPKEEVVSNIFVRGKATYAKSGTHSEKYSH